jgi:hypothetical protein
MLKEVSPVFIMFYLLPITHNKTYPNKISNILQDFFCISTFRGCIMKKNEGDNHE